MEPRSSIRNGFANGSPTHSHFYAAWNSRHESSMIPKALKFATLQKKWPPYIPILLWQTVWNCRCRTRERKPVTVLGSQQVIH